jgi:hypothetical protein
VITNENDMSALRDRVAELHPAYLKLAQRPRT